MEILLMLRDFITLGIVILLFGFLPGLGLGAIYHRYLLEDDED